MLLGAVSFTIHLGKYPFQRIGFTNVQEAEIKIEMIIDFPFDASHP